MREITRCTEANTFQSVGKCLQSQSPVGNFEKSEIYHQVACFNIKLQEIKNRGLVPFSP